MISIEDEEKKQAEEEQREAEAQAQQEDKEARMEDEGLNENSMDIGDDEAESDDDSNDSGHRRKRNDDNDKEKENAEKEAEENAEDTKEKAEDDIKDQKGGEKGKGENTEDLNPNDGKNPNENQPENESQDPSKTEKNQPEDNNPENNKPEKDTPERETPENNTPENSNPEGNGSEPSPETGGQELNPPEKMNAGDFGNTPGAGTAAEGEAAAGEGAAGAGEAGAAGGEAAAAGGSAAAEGAAGGAAAAEGAATGAAAGATAGEAAAAGAATAGGVAAAPVLLIVLLVILIIIIVIGVAGFFTTMPQFLWNRLKQIALSLWDGVQGYVIGMDESTVNKDDIIYTAQYLYDMGYDLVGMGFAESVEIYGQKDEDGNEIPVEDGHSKNEIKKVDAPYLRAYLVAENRTYLVNNYTFNLKDFANSFFDGSIFDEGMDTWGTGMIDLDSNLLERIGMPLTGLRVGEYNLGELIKGVKVERETNTMRIRRWNIHWDFWNARRDYTYYSLEGWTGRYGKPFELLLTLHVATMAPDLVKEFALNDDLDAKVHVKLRDTDFSGIVLVDGKTIDELEDAGTYSEDTIEALRKFEKKRASDINTSIPYISSVTKHWFRNVYFEGTDSDSADKNTLIGVDDDGDGLEDYNETSGPKTQKTKKLSSSDNVYNFGDETNAEMSFSGDLKEEFGEAAAAELGGAAITLQGSMEDGVVQTKDAVRGVTNPTTKELFSKKYYIYDGTVATAKKIQEARAKKDNSIKEKISFTKDSLQAFTILEESETLDAQYIYRDLKELVIELGYFEKEDFYEIEKQVLEWPIAEYVPGEWPDREIEKEVYEYGTLIACDETVAYSLGMSVQDLRKMTATEDEIEENDDNEDEDAYKNTLKSCTFIGDEYLNNLKNNVDLGDAEFYVKDGSDAQYWINNIAKIPADTSRAIIYTGLNNPKEYKAGENLVDALLEKCEGISIYVIEVMHVGENCKDADELNKLIDTYNSHLREKCKRTKGATFLNASTGLLMSGYLAYPDSSNRVLSSDKYEKFAKNIYFQMKNRKGISSNATDEEFVEKFLKSAKEVTTYIKENGFEYGNADYMPPKSDGTTTEDGSKKISGDRMVAWALYKSGYTDQPESGLCVGEKGDFVDYCESKEWQRIENVDDVQAGDIVFTGQLDDEGLKAKNVFICAGEGQNYNCNSQNKINAESQPIKENIGSDFMCAYRVTGDGVISTGFAKDLDVTAMGNGKVTEIYNEDNNIFSEQILAESIYGEKINKVTDEVPGREQSLEGIRIKLTDKALKGYVLVMYGFKVDSKVQVGKEIKTGDILGKTLDSDICLILIDRDKAVVENIEEYIKVPKKVKQVTNDFEWALFYWLPFESGAADVTESYQRGRYTGPACVSSCSSGEVAIGIVQWTSLGNMCNQRDQFLPFMKENYPQFYAKLSFLADKGSSYYWSDYNGANAVQKALLDCDKMDHETFLQAQMECAKANYYDPLIKAHPWLEQKAMCVQGEILHLSLWGANISDLDSHKGDSDAELLAYVRHKIANTNSTAGEASGDESSGRAFSEPEIGYGILDGRLTEADVEEWVRTGDTSVLTSKGVKYNGP